MRIQRLKISNVLGIESFDFEAAKFNLIEGANAAGKTSILEALKAVVSGGHDATLLRKGAERGEIVLVIENEGSEVVARKTITASASRLQVNVRDGAEVQKPQSFLAALVDAMSANPISFLTAPTAKRAELLLEALPMTVTPDQLQEATGIVCSSESTEGHALDVIDAVAKSVFDERTGVNRAAREKRATVKQMEEALPPAPVMDPEEQLAQIKREMAELTQRYERAAAELRERKQAIEEAARKGYDAGLKQLTDILAAAKDGASREFVTTNLKLQQEYESPRVQLAKRETEALQLIRASAGHQTVRQLAREAQDLEEKSAGLTTALQRLETLKQNLLAKLPIPGLEVRGREILYRGIPLDRVNKAEQIKIALAVARLRAGKLGLVCVDGLEALDADTFAAFESGALKSKLQYFVSRVAEGPLHLTARG